MAIDDMRQVLRSNDQGTSDAAQLEVVTALKISVVVVTWNGWPLLREMLLSVLASAKGAGIESEIIVVDNGSSDDTISRLAKDFPSVTAIGLGRNEGFARANNIGVSAATGDVVVLLNNDLVVEARFFEALREGLVHYGDVEVFATQMLRFSHPGFVDNRGIYLAISGFHRQRDAGKRREPERSSGPVYGASGGAMAIRREFLVKYGLFDEALGTYLEDADFAFRAKRSGTRCVYLADAIVYHHGSATGDLMPDWKYYQIIRNQAVLGRRMRIGLWGRILLVPQLLYLGLRLLGAIRQGRVSLTLRALKEAKGVRQDIRGFAPFRGDGGTIMSGNTSS